MVQVFGAGSLRFFGRPDRGRDCPVRRPPCAASGEMEWQAAQNRKLFIPVEDCVRNAPACGTGANPVGPLLSTFEKRRAATEQARRPEIFAGKRRSARHCRPTNVPDGSGAETAFELEERPLLGRWGGQLTGWKWRQADAASSGCARPVSTHSRHLGLPSGAAAAFPRLRRWSAFIHGKP